MYYFYSLLFIFALLLPSCTEKTVEQKQVKIYEPELVDTQDVRIQQITVQNNTIFKLTIPRANGCRHKIFYLGDYKNHVAFIKHESSSKSDYFVFKAFKPGTISIMFDRICPEWEGKPHDEWPTDISKKQVNIIITE